MNAGELRQKELNYVETPLMAQLAALGWDTIGVDMRDVTFGFARQLHRKDIGRSFVNRHGDTGTLLLLQNGYLNT